MTSKFREALDSIEQFMGNEYPQKQTIRQALLIAERLESGEVIQKMIDGAAKYRLSEGRSERGRADATGTFKAMAKVMIEEVKDGK